MVYLTVIVCALAICQFWQQATLSYKVGKLWSAGVENLMCIYMCVLSSVVSTGEGNECMQIWTEYVCAWCLWVWCNKVGLRFFLWMLACIPTHILVETPDLSGNGSSASHHVDLSDYLKGPFLQQLWLDKRASNTDFRRLTCWYILLICFIWVY